MEDNAQDKINTDVTPEKSNSDISNVANEMRKCPFCKELIIEDAVKCKHCSSVLVPIADNFNIGQSSGGVNQSVQIVSPTEKTSHIVQPLPHNDSMLGHGWGGLIIALIFLSIIGNLTGDDAVGAAVLGAIIVIPWMIWLITRPSANKALPAITLILATLGLLASFGM